MNIERRIAAEYPIRYSAFEYPRVLFVAPVTTIEGSTSRREYAAYHEPIRNVYYPLFDDGIYAEICSFQGKSYLATIHATQPRKERTQKTEHRFFDDFTQAATWIELQIPLYRCFCIRKGKVQDI